MKVFRGADTESRPADALSFVGAARTRLLAADTEGVAVKVYRVDFAPGARTNWHTHSGAQWLFVIEGAIRVQCWGERAREVEAGDLVAIPPGEKHWHGAAPGSSGSHLAVNVEVATEWLEPVSEDQYQGEG